MELVDERETAPCNGRRRGIEGEPSELRLSVRGVSKKFGGVRAVDNIDLDVRKTEILSIIGPNGAGKTSLLNMISGFYKPDSGQILLDGFDITGRKPSRVAALGVARTFQNIALFRKVRSEEHTSELQ